MNAAEGWKQASLRQTPEDLAALKALLGVSHAYAVAPFVSVSTVGRPGIAVALSPPPLFDTAALIHWDANPDSDVIVIDKGTGSVRLLGDEPSSHILGDLPVRHEVTLFTDGRRFARAWALARQAHIDRYLASAVPGIMPCEPVGYGLPGLVLAGKLENVRGFGRLMDADKVLVDAPSIVTDLHGHLMHAFGVPNVSVMGPQLSVVAS